jgi:histidyl-tRNA synthetase
MASSTVNPPRGMRDFLPQEKEVRERTLATIREHFSRYGYQEIETPAVEELARLTTSDGGDNEKLIFRILKRNLAAAAGPAALADLGLRFDLTVPLARFYATNRAKLPEVFRAIQIGPVWRAERPQKGRFRQFTQCDLDVIGEPGVLAESELITATLHTLGALGLEGCTVRVNDRRLLVAMLAACGFDPGAYGRVLITVDKLDKIGLDGVDSELAAGGHDRTAIRRLLELLGESTYLPGGPVEDVTAIAAAVTSVAGPQSVRLDPTLVRGMGYYTGPIFEIEHPASANSIAGGGRYDGMIGRFAGVDVPACGFSIGFERIVDLIKVDTAPTVPRMALVYGPDVDPGRLLRVQDEFISTGRAVRLVRTTKRLSRLLDSLREEGFTEFAVVDRETAAADDSIVRPIS